MTSTAQLDERIARLQAKRDEKAAEVIRAEQYFNSALEALGDALARSETDVYALIELPHLLRAYTRTCRNYHRVVTGQKLKRRKQPVGVVALGGFTQSDDEALS